YDRVVGFMHMRTQSRQSGQHQNITRYHWKRAGEASLPAAKTADGEGVERVILRQILEGERRILSFAPERAANQHVGEHGLTVERDGGLKGARETEAADLVGAQPLDLGVFVVCVAAGVWVRYRGVGAVGVCSW